MKVKDIYEFLDFCAPFDSAAEWDNCGLSVGSMEDEVKKITVALDVTKDVIKEAVENGSQLVVSHHPLLFRPCGSLDKDSVVYCAAASGLDFISSHTCLDKAVGGVNDCLARKLGIVNLKETGVEFLKIGEIAGTDARAFAELIKHELGGTVRYNDSEKTIKKVAVCSGAGGDLITDASRLGADALVTGEAKHHEFLTADELGTVLFEAGHFETENPVCSFLQKALSMEFEGIEVVQAQSHININAV